MITFIDAPLSEAYCTNERVYYSVSMLHRDMFLFEQASEIPILWYEKLCFKLFLSSLIEEKILQTLHPLRCFKRCSQ